MRFSKTVGTYSWFQSAGTQSDQSVRLESPLEIDSPRILSEDMSFRILYYQSMTVAHMTCAPPSPTTTNFRLISGRLDTPASCWGMSYDSSHVTLDSPTCFGWFYSWSRFRFLTKSNTSRSLLSNGSIYVLCCCWWTALLWYWLLKQANTPSNFALFWGVIALCDCVSNQKWLDQSFCLSPWSEWH